MTSKTDVRRMILGRVAALPKAEKAKKDEAIAARLLSSAEYARARSIFLYYSDAREADTHLILARALSDGKAVYLPRVEGEEMVLVPFREGDKLSVGVFGILEPQGAGVAASPDLAIIPLVAFDRERGRLGRGKGYYDRFLRAYKGDSLALAYAEQEADAVPMDALDVKVGAILTDKERIG